MKLVATCKDYAAYSNEYLFTLSLCLIVCRPWKLWEFHATQFQCHYIRSRLRRGQLLSFNHFQYSNDILYYQTYLPAFRACVEKGGAGSIMCSYNAVNGIPNCASDYLNNQIARGQWGFEGYIVRIIIFPHCILVLYRSVIVVL